MPFVRTSSDSAVPATPVDLYRNDLNPGPGAVPGLWAHQSEMLTKFAAHDTSADIALELPTGTGKTLTGLLIAEWTRRKRRARVIYAVPTKQLARQVVGAASAEGISTALLIGRSSDWPGGARAAYEAASAIAVTTYSSIFNTHPRLADADLILFDDAHAGEQYVGEAYGVNINRWAKTDEYRAVLSAVAPALDGVFLDRLGSAEPDPSISADVRVVVPLRQPDMLGRLAEALATCSGAQSYQFAMVRTGLSSCLVYVSYSGILVRPYIPPTHENSLFSGARQRVYLSATLGEGGELERAFGRSEIVRLEQPATPPRYGRRFFVFPDFIEGANANEFARAVVQVAGKALVLAPRKDIAMADATALAQPKWMVMSVDNVAEGMGPFIALKNGVCGLAARYDGLDLPGESCRVVALDGVPDQDNLQERFLQNRARASVALASRVRTRVIQGAGRCTRGPRDTAIVLVLGGELSRYLTRPEVTEALDPELQAELRFGRENSQGLGKTDVLENVRAFLEQESDETWRTGAEPVLTDYRKEMVQRMPDGTSALAASSAHEVQAWAAASVQRWSDAATHAHEAARLVGAGGRDTAGYRAFWLYLEAAWADHAAEQVSDRAGRAAALALIRQAEQVLGLGSWVRQMAPFPASERSPLAPVDALAVSKIAGRLASGVNQATVLRRLGAIHAGLAERAAGKYEPALTDLGKLLAADAFKPEPKGRCDSVWPWGNELWLAVEAKSDHEPTGVVPHKDVRQANDQLRLLASDAGVEAAPIGSATILVSPKPGIHEDGVAGAESHVHFAPPSAIEEIAHDVDSAWGELLAKASGRTEVQLRGLVADTLNSCGVLPSQVHERLTRDPINARVS
ncbi:DEAD/DEAH box helicase [Rathayibacter sp. SD072]|uniref:DEAD/DEAH box helicase n=1 Tax=Rathayibacter sp. SD072 TaxID=2781731 RepID=UPI001A96C991|nr:DEAD/DEAH box helicase [Rathayibacter sp. SD072]MBO0983838.1 DEAD/DEAH box helicase family protein [Rathayibacter sp. SD072]